MKSFETQCRPIGSKVRGSADSHRETNLRPVRQKMAELLGENPNLLDDLFKELEDWEAILSTLPDFNVDDLPGENDPPDLSPR
ncbi:hypothetical protein [Roseibium sp.]|uniref:hypothetical protein n=1 Tax=Roseibium sp. TaxID=1936156 RepID=UPI003A979A3A